MDNLTRAQRSLCMSRVRNKNTSLELLLRRELHARGYRYALHRKDLPGTPDITLPAARIAIFVHGDFWHGYKFLGWRDKLSPFWRAKIEQNILRDRRNSRLLRRLGWRVVTVWQHQLKVDLTRCVKRVARNIDEGRAFTQSAKRK